MSYLELKDIHKSYYIGKTAYPVLKGLNLNFDLGEFVTILGESGGGKSTLMNIIGGLDRDFTGTVKLQGQPLDHHHEHQLDQYRRETIGYIYQAYNLISHLNVLDNVMLSLDMTRLSRAARLKRARGLLNQVGLTDQLKKYPSQLSGGQKQRVAIARALASDPQVIIADEPTGALDSQNTAEVLAILQKIAANGRLVICVTHSSTVAHAGTRVVQLTDGKITDDQVIRAPAKVTKSRAKLASRPLPWHISLLTAFKHLRHTWTWNALIVLGTAIGLFAVMLFIGLGNGLKGYINHQINSLVDPQSITVMRYVDSTKDQEEQFAAQADPSAAGSFATHMPTFSTSQVTELQHLTHVVKVEPGIAANDAMITIGKTSYSAPQLTTWTSANQTSALKAGHLAGNNQIILDQQSIAQKWSANNWRKLVGQKVTVAYRTLNSQNQLVTVQRQLTVAGIAASSTGAGLNAINYETMQSMRAAAKVTTQPTFVTVRIKNRQQNEAVVSAINHLKVNGQQQFAATSISSALATVNTYVNLATMILAAIAGISLLVSALMIIVTMFMSVSARMKEIGILRSLGESRRDIRRLFTSESLMLGVLSAILATGLAYGIGLGLNQILYRIAGYNLVQLEFSNVVVIFIIALVIAWLAAILPARRAARLNPITALATE
ncbi:ATP-binding cassette domain-containing protein [Lactiplantibacillus sp. WILCCON 0030]|uniref:ATP-binding cassette domain-containing protein n=1 Tax=Lactiplantibacillus brownii TaxID=3069269 RepID=A0ABU1A8F3_9LACO|nr:ATP-binding cassette domain-containing protein [Lactiplantibacillus brownii]MDQ7937156.1 ATP-binding cassette domain-containing protein [Lactiplantibacillus brownii]